MKIVRIWSAQSVNIHQAPAYVQEAARFGHPSLHVVDLGEGRHISMYDDGLA